MPTYGDGLGSSREARSLRSNFEQARMTNWTRNLQWRVERSAVQIGQVFRRSAITLAMRLGPGTRMRSFTRMLRVFSDKSEIYEADKLRINVFCDQIAAGMSSF